MDDPIGIWGKGRSPCGERGLKSSSPRFAITRSASRSPCGERGLKYDVREQNSGGSYSRSPCGERGLKCQYGRTVAASAASLPVRGAWIEIPRSRIAPGKTRSSLPVRGAWIEI